MILWDAYLEDPSIPTDPELFVASQPLSGPYVDPWTILAQAEAGRRYRKNVTRIIRRLRRELKQEIRRTEALTSQGRSLSALIRLHDARFSPLGLYITAHRAERPDLAELLRFGAIAQHKSCPLYRAASLALLPAKFYPMVEHHRSLDDQITAEMRLETASCN